MKLQVRRLTVIKIVFYATVCAALSVSFFVGDFRRITSSLQFWGMFAAFQAGLLSSLIPFHNVALKQISIALTALVVMNLFSPLLNFIGEPVTTLQPNLRQQFRVAGGAVFGIDGIQTITTDSKGYRTNTPIDYARKDPDTLRIIAIGGSTTEDIYLDDAKTWTFLLAARLSKALNRPVEMINTGVSGLRARHHLLTLQESEKFSPDIAVVMMGLNDWTSYQIGAAQHGSGSRRLYWSFLHRRNRPVSGHPHGARVRQQLGKAGGRSPRGDFGLPSQRT